MQTFGECQSKRSRPPDYKHYHKTPGPPLLTTYFIDVDKRANVEPSSEKPKPYKRERLNKWDTIDAESCYQRR